MVLLEFKEYKHYSKFTKPRCSLLDALWAFFLVGETCQRYPKTPHLLCEEAVRSCLFVTASFGKR